MCGVENAVLSCVLRGPLFLPSFECEKVNKKTVIERERADQA